MKNVKNFLKDLKTLSGLPVSKKYSELVLPEYPFDLQLLAASGLYRKSRSFYLGLGGAFQPRLCSTMRSLSAQDLFKDEIDYTPSFSQMLWFKDHFAEIYDPAEELNAMMNFSDISLFHEQNHRVIWRLLPPAPIAELEINRYLNFAESLVVMLDIALADEIGKEFSLAFERVSVLYRPGDGNKWHSKSKLEYRRYLLSFFCATYCVLELIDPRDVLKALNYILPDRKEMNKSATKRALQINEHFSRITNPEWQKRYWKSSGLKLKKLHAGKKEPVLILPNQALDLESELFYVHRVLEHYSL